MTDPQPRSWNNGLLASSYVPLTDVEPSLAPRLLTALERARIAAYLAVVPHGEGPLRLYVAAGERADARTIVTAVVRADGGDPRAGRFHDADSTDPGDGTQPPRPDPLAGIDADAEFAALIADWHVDTHTAIRDAERDLTREDEDWRLRLNKRDPEAETAAWLDEEHYVPPNPPPLPRPTVPIVLGLLLLVVSILFFAFGHDLGMPSSLSLFLGVTGILAALGLFVMRLREYRDDDDDGAIL